MDLVTKVIKVIDSCENRTQMYHAGTYLQLSLKYIHIDQMAILTRYYKTKSIDLIKNEK